jgi:hypothetical protein
MTEHETTERDEWHRKFAGELFNLTWELLDKVERTADENERMLHAAHASRFHWDEIGAPLQFARGEWQISRVYAVLGRGEPALHHGRRCLDICTEDNIGDFDLAFAYEALARAYAVAGDRARSEAHLRLAELAGAEIKDQGDRDYFLSELKTVSILLQ